jgi:hypothetical protein
LFILIGHKLLAFHSEKFDGVLLILVGIKDYNLIISFIKHNIPYTVWLLHQAIINSIFPKIEAIGVHDLKAPLPAHQELPSLLVKSS